MNAIHTSRQVARFGDLAHRFGRRATLIVGFTSLTIAIVIAHLNPASQYEISVYSGTPILFWIAVSIAFVTALSVCVSPGSDLNRLWAVFLGGLSTVAVIGIPLLRGYAFYGTGDPLSHMGWIRNILGGELALADLIYPGLHSVSIFLHRLFGVELGRAMLIGSGLFIVSFLVFTPLLVYVITDDRGAAMIGAFSAFLLLPVNNISVHVTAFPSTIAIFFVPLVLLLLVVYLTEIDQSAWFHPIGILLALTATATVMYHPQQASNLLLVFLAVSTVGVIKSKIGTDDGGLRPTYGQTAFLAVVLAIWSATHARIGEAAAVYSSRTISSLLGTGPSGTDAIVQRTGSLGAIGASKTEIGVKLFLVSFVYLCLTGALIGADLTGRLKQVSDRERSLPLLGLALVPIGLIMLLYISARLETIYFRHLGFIMVLATVLGSIAIWRGVGAARARGRPKQMVAGVLVIVFATMLVLSLSTVYSSPYIYKSSGHVTEQHLDGYETAFHYESNSVPYVGIRTGPDRFRDGLLGVTDVQPRSERRANRVPFGSLDGDLTAVFDGPHYVAVTDADVQRETISFKNLRYSERGFRTLGQQPGVNRVIANEGFQLYYVSE